LKAQLPFPQFSQTLFKFRVYKFVELYLFSPMRLHGVVFKRKENFTEILRQTGRV
jgi:hypothetical protein